GIIYCRALSTAPSDWAVFLDDASRASGFIGGVRLPKLEAPSIQERGIPWQTIPSRAKSR
ncbi:hypothetical protein, partial [Achromobacter spanius]|uniref:hypothetical protein n=1 Tax=Achromobacter spanius TaxID=217203 RepID=UPI003F693D65